MNERAEKCPTCGSHLIDVRYELGTGVNDYQSEECTDAWHDWEHTVWQETPAMSEQEKLREALREIVKVASGERQVADDDTGGMAWIDKFARAALLSDTPPAGLSARTPGEDAWLDEIEHAIVGGNLMSNRDKLRTILRAYRANLLTQREATLRKEFISLCEGEYRNMFGGAIARALNAAPAPAGAAKGGSDDLA